MSLLKGIGVDLFKMALKYLVVISPRVWVDNHRLYARTNMLIQVLSLFSYSKNVIVDRMDRIVTIRKRRFWFFFKVFGIPFKNIGSIDYSLGIWTLIEVERFTISLCLLDTDKKVKLFSFMGSEEIGIETVGYRLAELRENQDDASWKYLKFLQDFTGKSWP